MKIAAYQCDLCKSVIEGSPITLTSILKTQIEGEPIKAEIQFLLKVRDSRKSSAPDLCPHCQGTLLSEFIMGENDEPI